MNYLNSYLRSKLDLSHIGFQRGEKWSKEGDKFRYPTDYGLVYSLQLTQVDYYQAVYWLIGIFNFMLGCSDMLDVAYKYECDMRSEYL